MQEKTQEHIEQRRKKAENLVELGINPYSNDFTPDHKISHVLAACENHDAEALSKARVAYSLAGRIMVLRSFGKAAFIKIQDRSGSLQVYLQKNVLGEEIYQQVVKNIEVGDIIGVKGVPMRTRTGELTIQAEFFKLVTKSLRPLPEKWHGLKDVETRYRQRYVDLIANREVLDIFMLRSRMVGFLRRFLEEKGFLEVETPMLHTLAGGAAARPFATHHNALGLELYLRVAPELYLKRLLVGGLERIYELNRCFRNEGVSTQHNPEFTMLEFYQAYATYQDLMNLTEELLGGMAFDLKGSKRIMYQGNEISLEPGFRRLTLTAAVAEKIDAPQEVLNQPERLYELAGRHGMSLKEHPSVGKLQMELFEQLVEPTLIQPTFILDFPLDVSPLSRKKEGQPDLVDRFELYIAGREIANAFSELNDPDDQRSRFQAQMEAKAQGDEEAMPYDHDYIRALEYGMPSAAGEGIGIDRLVMLMADAPSIRDVILFPLLKPER